MTTGHTGNLRAVPFAVVPAAAFVFGFAGFVTATTDALSFTESGATVGNTGGTGGVTGAGTGVLSGRGIESGSCADAMTGAARIAATRQATRQKRDVMRARDGVMTDVWVLQRRGAQTYRISRRQFHRTSTCDVSMYRTREREV